MGQGGSPKSISGQPGFVYAQLPKRDKPPGRCPFYGFSHSRHAGAYVQVPGGQPNNQCGLCRGGYRPCQMEVEGHQPDWGRCPLHLDMGRAELETLKNTAIFFPSGSHAGMSYTLQEWWDKVVAACDQR